MEVLERGVCSKPFLSSSAALLALRFWLDVSFVVGATTGAAIVLEEAVQGSASFDCSSRALLLALRFWEAVSLAIFFS